MSLIGAAHSSVVYGRRVRVLTDHLAAAIPRGASVLDVGCGDGLISSLVKAKRPDITVEGIEILLRPQTHIPVKLFDGKSIPHPDKSFDVVMFVDVLHHTDDATVLLKEAARVARKAVVIKDHLRNGILAGSTLRFMDYVGNAHLGVRLPYNYWSRAEWDRAFATCGLTPEDWNRSRGLYPWWASWAFGRGLHFVGRMAVRA